MRNTTTHYGWLSIALHWLAALSIFGLFALGYWMVELGYYHTWYKTGPALHKSIGVMLLLLMIFRLIWRLVQVQPQHIATHKPIERKAGSVVHAALYLLIFVIIISGYLISTADGRGIAVFSLFTLPSLGAFIDNQEDIAGLVHQFAAYTVIALASLHAIAAFKHHVIEKDDTLKRMLGKRPPVTDSVS